MPGSKGSPPGRPKQSGTRGLLDFVRGTLFVGHRKTEKLFDKTKSSTYDQLCLGIPLSNLWQLLQLIDENAQAFPFSFKNSLNHNSFIPSSEKRGLDCNI